MRVVKGGYSQRETIYKSIVYAKDNYIQHLHSLEQKSSENIYLTFKMIIKMGVHSVWINDEDNSIVVEYTGEYVKEIKKRIALMNDKSIEVNYVDSPPMKPLQN